MAQTHFHDGACLYFRKLETFHQVGYSLVRSLGSADDADYLVDVVRCDNQTFQDVGALFRLTQVIACAADNHFVAMFNEQVNQVFQIQQFRTSVNQCDVIHAKRSLQRCHLKQLVQHHAGVRIAFYIDNDSHTFAVRFIVYVRNTVDFLFVY